MKKLFVSVPTKGRTEEEIKSSIQKMKKIAQICEGEELELIDSYIKDNPPKDIKEAVWYLGESLKKLSQADVFYWNTGTLWLEWLPGWFVTAQEYGIKSYIVSAPYVIDNYYGLLEKQPCNDPMPAL